LRRVGTSLPCTAKLNPPPPLRLAAPDDELVVEYDEDVLRSLKQREDFT
jgi:hypothetical protein